jgi:hypothetical protein
MRERYWVTQRCAYGQTRSCIKFIYASYVMSKSRQRPDSHQPSLSVSENAVVSPRPGLAERAPRTFSSQTRVIPITDTQLAIRHNSHGSVPARGVSIFKQTRHDPKSAIMAAQFLMGAAKYTQSLQKPAKSFVLRDRSHKSFKSEILPLTD